jgi:hypothetical protein
MSKQRCISRRIALAAIILIGLILCSCGGPRRDLVGKWRSAGEANTTIWEFSSNGGVTIGSTQGRYSFGDRDRIKIETGSSTAVYELELTGDRMMLKDFRGSKNEFVRVK